jgi:DNA-binding beta-propeller fold protein YncE
VDQALSVQSDSAPGAISLPGGPVGLLAAAGALWVAVPSANQVARVNPYTDVVTATVTVADTPLRLAAAGGGVWVSEFRNGTIARFDPRTQQVTCRIAIGDQPEGLATDGRTLWVVLEQPDRLVEVDGGTGAVRRTINLPDGAQPRLALYDKGTVWVADYLGNRLVPVDAAKGTVGDPVTGCEHPQGLAVAGDRLWVACLGTEEVVAVRTTGTREIAERVRVPRDPDGVSFADGRLYVALSDGPGVRAIDVAGGTIGRAQSLGSSGPLTDANVDVLAVGGQVWVTSFNEQRLYHRDALSIR